MVVKSQLGTKYGGNLEENKPTNYGKVRKCIVNLSEAVNKLSQITILENCIVERNRTIN